LIPGRIPTNLCFMIYESLLRQGLQNFREAFRQEPTSCGYAPGRVEVLGNHTDYNEGYVLSAAIDRGALFLAARSEGEVCRVIASDLKQKAEFPLRGPKPDPQKPWVNYVMGVSVKLREKGSMDVPFYGLLLGNVPLGAGLSSSAALEMSTALALTDLFGLSVKKMDLARIGQAAEHEYAGAKTGLLDQITSLYGQKDHLVLSDFRSLEVDTVPLGGGLCFLICNTGVRHSLVDSEYNERRRSCEEATRFFADHLDHPVRALRDVSLEEWERLKGGMDPVVCRRSAHIIGENRRVLEARGHLQGAELRNFGRLMFQSHESSRTNFENSCEELDFVVETAGETPQVLGARLSGGGFGGSVVILLKPEDLGMVKNRLHSAYEKRFGTPCELLSIDVSEGARIVSL